MGGGAAEKMGASGIKNTKRFNETFTTRSLSRELLRGCQVVQSCQNQTASLLPTQEEERKEKGEGPRGREVSLSLSAVVFSKVIILKSLFKREKNQRRYRHFVFPFA